MSDAVSHRFHHARRQSRSIALATNPSLLLLAGSIVVLSVILGGGAQQGRWSDAITELASLALIVLLAFQAPQFDWHAFDRFAAMIVAALLLLPLLQLVRLPPSIWAALPGRETFANAYVEAGIALPWLPISLDPAATWLGWLGLLPATAVFFATVALDVRARRSLSLLFIGLGIVSVLLGLAQLMQGPASALRFYPFTNTGSSVGFFADRNHYAAFLTILIPIVAAWAIGIVYDRRANRVYALVICLLIFAVLILGIGMAASRAGVALALIAAIASFFLIPAGERRLARISLAAIGAAAAVGIILAIQFAFFRVLGRFEADILADLRFTIADVTASAVWTYFPFGTGFGTFEAIYRIFEPHDALLTAYVNHAHNDWLEALLEGGVLAAGIMLGFLIWFVSRSFIAWRSPAEPGRVLDRTLARAATIAALLLLLFSLVEYPLRTTTLSVAFAWLAAMLIAPLHASAESHGAPSAAADSTWRRHAGQPHRRRNGAHPRSFHRRG